MAKTIFLFNDGTGQFLDSPNQSNVAKIFRALPGNQEKYSERNFLKKFEENNYYAYYISGVGTDEKLAPPEDANFITSLKIWLKNIFRKFLNQAHGRQIAKKIEQNIDIIDKEWSEGDQVYFVGFSRGAASIRITASYLSKYKPQFKVNYMLIYDTVYSVLGSIKIKDEGPIARFSDYDIAPFVSKADHLIAGDETREKFNFTKVNQRNNVRQILFSGSHSDVGGGHSDSSLSDIALSFSINELKSLGINFDVHNLQALQIKPDATGPIQQSKLTNSGQDHGPRDLSKNKFLIHKSVFNRCNKSFPIPLSLSTLIKVDREKEEELTEFSSENCKLSKVE